MFKQAGKLNTENEDKGLHSDDDEEPRPPNNSGQKGFPPQVRIVNMIYATHIPKREWKHALKDVYALEPVAPKFNPWSSYPITFDRRDHPTSIRHGGFAALVLDPIIESSMTDASGMVPLIKGDRAGGPWVELWGDWLYRVYVP